MLIHNFAKWLKAFICAIFIFVTWLYTGHAVWATELYRSKSTVSSNSEHYHTTVQIHFLGSAGTYLKLGNNALLTDPYFSNHSIWNLISFRPLKPNILKIKNQLDQLDNISAILISHGHYNHLADVPFILSLLPRSTRVYASNSVQNSLAFINDYYTILGLDNRLNTKNNHWITLPNQAIRFLPSRSEHAPHFANIRLANDSLSTQQQALPQNVAAWKSGLTISYLIDFLEPHRGNPIFRIFYQSSASKAPAGFPSISKLNDDKSVDVAILSVANYANVDEYPQRIIRYLRPKTVILIHWEKFWQPDTSENPQPMPGIKIDDFITRVNEAAETYRANSDFQVIWPAPGAVVQIPVGYK